MPTSSPDHRRRAGALAAVPLLFGTLAIGLPSGVLATSTAPAGPVRADSFTGTIAPGVHVGTIDLSGLDEQTARNVLLQAFAAVGQGQVSVIAGPTTTAITYADISRRVDIDTLINQAFSVGRTGSSVDRVLQMVKAGTGGESLTPTILFDQGVLAQKMNDAAAASRVVVKNARAVRTRTGFDVEEAADGQEFDATAAIPSVSTALQDPNAPADLHITLTGTSTPPVISNMQAELAKTQAEAMEPPIVLANGGQTWTIPQNVVHSWINFKILDGNTITIALNHDAIVKAVTKLAPQINRDPVDASWAYAPNGVKVVPAVNGRAVDVERTSRRIEIFLQGRADGSVLPDKKFGPTTVATEPGFTTAEAEKASSKFKLLSTWTTYFQPAAHNGYGANIWVPAGYLDNQVVAPGQTFSFWDRVGEVSLARGYKMGGAIVDGHTQEGVALAGGICSTSTTLFNAALRAGLKMGDRSNHYYYITRYPVGLDATVSKTSGGGGQNMTFTNDTAYPILIKSFKTGGSVTFSLYGIPTGRKVTFSKPIITNYVRATSEVVHVSTLPAGRLVRIEYPDDGFNAQVTAYVRGSNGKLISSRTYFSRYSMVRGVQYLGDPNGKPISVPSYAPGAQGG